LFLSPPPPAILEWWRDVAVINKPIIADLGSGKGSEKALTRLGPNDALPTP